MLKMKGIIPLVIFVLIFLKIRLGSGGLPIRPGEGFLKPSGSLVRESESKRRQP